MQFDTLVNCKCWIFQGRDEAWIPYFAFGVCSLIGATCTVFLPETLNQHLPESVTAANNFGKDHAFWSVLPPAQRGLRKHRFPSAVSSIRRVHSSTRSSRGTSTRSSRRESLVAYVNQVSPTVVIGRRNSVRGFGGAPHP